MDKKQREFISLRADGVSFDKIAKELKLSKATLIQWSKLLESEIKEFQFLALAEVKRVYSHNARSKYEMLIKQLTKIDNAILDADLTKESIKDLIFVKNSLLQQLGAIESDTTTKAYLRDETQVFDQEVKAKLSDYD